MNERERTVRVRVRRRAVRVLHVPRHSPRARADKGAARGARYATLPRLLRNVLVRGEPEPPAASGRCSHSCDAPPSECAQCAGSAAAAGVTVAITATCVQRRTAERRQHRIDDERCEGVSRERALDAKRRRDDDRRFARFLLALLLLRLRLQPRLRLRRRRSRVRTTALLRSLLRRRARALARQKRVRLRRTRRGDCCGGGGDSSCAAADAVGAARPH